MFGTILVGYDATRNCADGLLLARLFAKLGRGRVIAACVYGYQRSTQVSSRTGAFASTYHDAEGALLALQRQIRGSIDVRPVLGLSAASGLQALAEDEDADLIVIASSARGRPGRTFPGRTANHLLRGAPCLVAVAPLGYRNRPVVGLRQIGIAFASDEEGVAALQAAYAIAQTSGAALTAISALHFGHGSGPDARRARVNAQHDLERAVAALGDDALIDRELLEGPAVSVLCERTERLDLLVVGSRSRGPITRTVLGSVSHGVLLDARCPILVLPRGVSVAAPALTHSSGVPDRPKNGLMVSREQLGTVGR